MLRRIVKGSLGFGRTSMVCSKPAQNWHPKNFCTKPGEMMRAVVIKKHGDPNVLEMSEIPRPIPGNTEVLVKVYAAAINPVDMFIRQGAFMSLPPLPLVLGKEAAGVVVRIGKDVKNVKEGDRVTCCLPYDGGYSEYAVCREKYIIPLSSKLTFAEGSSLYVSYFVAYRALVTKCNIAKGESLFVHGASGGVGLSAIQIAKSKGLTVFGSARSHLGREAILKAGADRAFDHSDEKYLVDVYSATNSKGFDVILENCADNNLGKDLVLLAPNGRIAVVGTKSTMKTKSAKSPTIVEPRSLMYTEGSIVGVKLIGVTPEEFVEYSKFIVEGVEEGWLRPHVGHQLPLKEASAAHWRMAQQPACGKIVLTVRPE